MLCLGVDVGGTFTDLVLYDPETQSIEIDKIPSSTDSQEQAILAGISRMDIAVDRLERLVHGTTVATNTVLEFTGAKIAIVTTAGHKDVLVVGRGNRMDTYNIKARSPKALISRASCFEIHERMKADGTVLHALEEREVESLAETLEEMRVEAVAVCFLHSYVNPAHEERCAEILRERLPGVVVAGSSEILREYREYERFSTAALNCYIAPRMQRYLGMLRDKLHEEGLSATLEIMTSNGGALPVERISAYPVLTMLSGPAAGVIAAAWLGESTGHRNLITCDIGGTSSDICVIHDLSFSMTSESQVATLPIKVQQIDIHTIAVGGGSIAQNSEGGFLAVGPRSAGSLPGPACYGRGGSQPTITDANLVLGRLSASRKFGGEITLDAEAARAAVGRLAQELGIGIEATAEGIIRLATVSLASAIKEVSIMSGQDPRDFVFLPYGGAGPLQAADTAAELGMNKVIVPPLPGNFSALGLLVSDARRDVARTRISRLMDTDVNSIKALLSELIDAAGREFDLAGLPAEGRIFSAKLDMRYLGQSFELPVDVPLAPASTEDLQLRFEKVYELRYGGIPAGGIVEIVNYRIVAVSPTRKPRLPEVSDTGRSLEEALVENRPVVFDGEPVQAAVYDRDRLPVGQDFDGPALVEEVASTTGIPPGWTGQMDRLGCLVLRRR